jgi:hypothetical protein
MRNDWTTKNYGLSRQVWECNFKEGYQIPKKARIWGDCCDWVTVPFGTEARHSSTFFAGFFYWSGSLGLSWSLQHLLYIRRPALGTEGFLSCALVDKATLGAMVFVPDKVIDGKVWTTANITHTHYPTYHDMVITRKTLSQSPGSIYKKSLI